MVLGRIVHYTVDAVLLSTVVAGVRRSSGFTSVLAAQSSRAPPSIFFLNAESIPKQTRDYVNIRSYHPFNSRPFPWGGRDDIRHGAGNGCE
jgi:hypothetical protein